MILDVLGLNWNRPDREPGPQGPPSSVFVRTVATASTFEIRNPTSPPNRQGPTVKPTPLSVNSAPPVALSVVGASASFVRTIDHAGGIRTPIANPWHGFGLMLTAVTSPADELTGIVPADVVPVRVTLHLRVAIPDDKSSVPIDVAVNPPEPRIVIAADA
jgi:hypothetical protein